MFRKAIYLPFFDLKFFFLPFDVFFAIFFFLLCVCETVAFWSLSFFYTHRSFPYHPALPNKSFCYPSPPFKSVSFWWAKLPFLVLFCLNLSNYVWVSLSLAQWVAEGPKVVVSLIVAPNLCPLVIFLFLAFEQKNYFEQTPPSSPLLSKKVLCFLYRFISTKKSNFLLCLALYSPDFWRFFSNRGFSFFFDVFFIYDVFLTIKQALFGHIENIFADHLKDIQIAGGEVGVFFSRYFQNFSFFSFRV